MATYLPPGYAPSSRPFRNELAVSGFYCSLAGLFLGWMACILPLVGLVLSLAALRRPPRLLAAAGAALGLFGLLLYGAIFYPWAAMFAYAVLGISTPESIQQQTDVAIGKAHQRIVDHYLESDELPDEKEGARMLSDIRDGWGRRLRYKRLAESFEVRSAGPDGALDTADDSTDEHYVDAELEFDEDGDASSQATSGSAAPDQTNNQGPPGAAGGPAGPGTNAPPPNAGPAGKPPQRRQNAMDKVFQGRSVPLLP